MKAETNQGSEEVLGVQLTMDNAVAGNRIVISPSANIIRFYTDMIAENGLSGNIIKGSDDELYIQGIAILIAPLKEFLETEDVTMFTENEETPYQNKSEEAIIEEGK